MTNFMSTADIASSLQICFGRLLSRIELRKEAEGIFLGSKYREGRFRLRLLHRRILHGNRVGKCGQAFPL